MTKHSLILVIPLFFLFGCSNENDKAVDKGHLLEGHEKQMDKARSLDKVIQDGIEKRQKGIEE